MAPSRILPRIANTSCTAMPTYPHCCMQTSVLFSAMTNAFKLKGGLCTIYARTPSKNIIFHLNKWVCTRKRLECLLNFLSLFSRPLCHICLFMQNGGCVCLFVLKCNRGFGNTGTPSTVAEFHHLWRLQHDRGVKFFPAEGKSGHTRRGRNATYGQFWTDGGVWWEWRCSAEILAWTWECK